MNKKIITIAEIVFALIFVVILAVIMGTVTNKGNSANTKLVDTLEMTDGTSLASYADGMTVKGETVKTAISQIKSIGGELKLQVFVDTLANSSYDTYDSEHKYQISDTTSAKYINPSASFTCWQMINNNGVVTGLHFVQDDGTDTSRDKPDYHN